MRRDAAWSWSAAAVLIALTLLTTGAAAVRACLWAPYSDPHGWLAALFDAEHAGAPWSVVWRPFNQQRIPLALLTQALDVEAVRGRAPSFLVLGAVAELAGLAAVVGAVARSRLNSPAAAALAAASAVVLGGVSVAEDLAFPVFSVYPVVAGFAAAAFAAMTLARREGWGGPALAVAVLSGALASGGNAAGLAVWPVLLFWAAVEHRGRRQQLALWAAALAVTAALERGLGPPAGSVAAPDLSAAQLVKMARYLLGFAGLWWGALAHAGPSRGLGLAVLAAAGAGLLRRGPEVEADGVRRLGRLLASFGLLTAALATLGRVDELPEPVVPTRYFPFAALLQLGALLCWSDRLAAAMRRRPMAAAAVALLSALAVLASQAKGMKALVATSRVIQAGSRAFDAGDRSPAVTRLVDAHPDMDAAVRAELRRRGLPW